MKKILLLFSILCFGFSSFAYAETAEEYLDKGVNALYQDKYEQAILYANKAIKKDPENISAYLLKYYNSAFLAFEQKKYRKVIKNINKILEFMPYEPDLYYLLGISYLESKQWEKSISAFSKMIKYNNDEQQSSKDSYQFILNAYKSRAMARFEIGDYDGVIYDLDKAIEISAKNKEEYNYIYYDRAQANFYKSDYQSAINDLLKNIKNRPEDADIYFLIATIQMYKGLKETNVNDFQLALSSLKTAKELYLENNNMDGYKKTMEFYQYLLTLINSFGQ